MTDISGQEARTDPAHLLQAAKPASEPARRRWFMPALLLLIVVSIPWYHRAGEIGHIAAGLTVWVWSTLACSVGISVLTAITAIFCWRDSTED